MGFPRTAWSVPLPGCGIAGLIISEGYGTRLVQVGTIILHWRLGDEA